MGTALQNVTAFHGSSKSLRGGIVMFGLFKNRAAKRYSRELAVRLRQSYGTAPNYTAAQIRAAATRIKLPLKYICFGYAGFLREEDYNTLTLEMTFYLPYQDARALLRRFSPSSAYSASENSETSDVSYGAGDY